MRIIYQKEGKKEKDVELCEMKNERKNRNLEGKKKE